MRTESPWEQFAIRTENDIRTMMAAIEEESSSAIEVFGHPSIWVYPDCERVYAITDELARRGYEGSAASNMRIVGVHHADFEGMNELVRFKFENDASPMAIGAYIMFRSLDLIWYDTVLA